LSDTLGAVFAALSDPTRRAMLDQLLREGSTSVPELAGQLPISRQAVAKHLASLQGAGLVVRTPGEGREVRYRLRPRALCGATAWLESTQDAWDTRVDRLKRALENPSR
jgi:DNA-binding transcriptional ArsR family regulator